MTAETSRMPDTWHEYPCLLLWGMPVTSTGIFLMMYGFRKSMKECIRTPEKTLDEVADDIDLKWDRNSMHERPATLSS